MAFGIRSLLARWLGGVGNLGEQPSPEFHIIYNVPMQQPSSYTRPMREPNYSRAMQQPTNYHRPMRRIN